MAIKTNKNEEIIEIKPVENVSTIIRIVGDTPLIVHNFDEKAKREILEKQMKATKTKSREPKNPIGDFINSMHWICGKPDTTYASVTENDFYVAVENGAKFGFPVTAIKQAANSAAYRNGLVKNQMALRGAYFIDGVGPNQLAEIKGDIPVMREDMVKIISGADIRYRGEFNNWHMDLTIRYNKNGPYSLEQIINLINLGGFCCGIGEWRPEKDGQYGMYHVEAI